MRWRTAERVHNIQITEEGRAEDTDVDRRQESSNQLFPSKCKCRSACLTALIGSVFISREVKHIVRKVSNI